MYQHLLLFQLLTVKYFFAFLFFTLSLRYPFCPAQAACLCDRLWIRPLWLPSEVWEPKRNLGTAVQKLVW